jgi:hypothetical protein
MARGTTQLVREVAEIYGVSERTVWRWFAKIRVTAPPDSRALEHLPSVPKKPKRCQHCGRPLPNTATIRARYCTDSHRAAAAYLRKTGA